MPRVLTNKGGATRPSATRPSAAAGSALWPLGLACLLCLLFSLFCIKTPPLLYQEDAVRFVMQGEELAAAIGAGGWLAHLRHPPLYPLLIALLSQLLGPLGFGPLQAAIFLCLAAQTLTVIALYLLHEEVFGRQGRLVTAAIAAIYPNVVLGAGLGQLSIFLCLLALAAYFAFSAARRRSVGRAALCGLFLGQSLLCRPEGFITFSLLCLLLGGWTARLGRGAAQLAAMTAALLCLLLPYGLWQKGRGDIPRPAAAWSLHLSAQEAGQAALRGSSEVTPTAAEAPGPAAEMFAARVRMVLGDAVWRTGAFHPLALALLLLGALRGRGRGPAILLLLALLHLLPALASGTEYAPADLGASLLFSVPLMAGGALLFAEWTARRFSSLYLTPRSVLFGIAGVLLLRYGSASIQGALRAGGGPRGRERAALLEQACLHHLPPGARILSAAGGNRCALLRHGIAVPLPPLRTLPELSAYLQEQQLDYAVLGTEALRRHPAAVRSDLLDPRRWPPSFTQVVRLFPDRDPIWLVRITRSAGRSSSPRADSSCGSCPDRRTGAPGGCSPP